MTNANELLTELLHTLHLRGLAASDEARKNLGAHAERLEAKLRAELARLAPLAEAAVALYDAAGNVQAEHATKQPDERALRLLSNELETRVHGMTKTAMGFAHARAQAQDGAA